MKNIHRWLSEYGESHKNRTNKRIHYVCVPLIMFSLIGLLWSIPSDILSRFFPSRYAPFANWATVFLLFTLLFYLRLSLEIFIGMLLIAAALLFGNYRLAVSAPYPLWLISLGIFAAAWIGQFIGHKIEGKKPSFLKDLQFLLIGPTWILSAVYKKLGIRY